MSTDTLDRVDVQALVELRQVLGVPSGADLEMEVAKHKASCGPEQWAALCKDARARAERSIAAADTKAAADHERARWATFESHATAAINARVAIDAAIVNLGEAVRVTLAATATAAGSFPGDVGIAPGLFGVPDLRRALEMAAVRAVNGALAESIAAPARGAVDLIAKVRAQ